MKEAATIDKRVSDLLLPLNQKLNDFTHEIAILSGRNNQTNTRLLDLERKCEEIDNLRHLRDKFTQNEEQFSKQQENVQCKMTGFSILVSGMKQSINSFQTCVSELMEQIGVLNLECQKCKRDCIALSKASQESNQLALDKTKSDLQNSLSILKQELVVSPKDISSQNDNVLKKLEIATLDCSNAVLRTTNLETSIRILEKKIENQNIQIKRIDLNYQEGIGK